MQPAYAAVLTAAASEAQDPKDYLYYKSGGAKWVTSADGKRRAVKRQHWECVRKDDGCQARKVTDHDAGSSNFISEHCEGPPHSHAPPPRKRTDPAVLAEAKVMVANGMKPATVEQRITVAHSGSMM